MLRIVCVTIHSLVTPTPSKLTMPASGIFLGNKKEHMKQNSETISFDKRFSYTPTDEAIARNPATNLSDVYKQYNAAGQNDRFEANLERLGLQNDPVIRLAKTAFLMTSVMKKRADGLEAAHPLYVANRGIEDLGHVDANKIAADLLHDVVEDDPDKLAAIFGYKPGRVDSFTVRTLQKLPENKLTRFYVKQRERSLALRAIAGTLSQDVSDHVAGVSNPIVLFDTPRNNSKSYQKHITRVANATRGKNALLPRLAQYPPLVRAGATKLARRAGIVTLDILQAHQSTKAADIINNAGENDRTSNPVLQLRTAVKHLKTIPQFQANADRFAPPDKVAKVKELLQQAEDRCRTVVEKYLEEHPDGPSLKQIRHNGKAALRGISLSPPDLGLSNVAIPPLSTLYQSVIDAQRRVDIRLKESSESEAAKEAA